MTRACLVDPFNHEVHEVTMHERPGAHDEQHEIDTPLDCDRIETIKLFDVGANVIALDESEDNYVREQIVWSQQIRNRTTSHLRLHGNYGSRWTVSAIFLARYLRVTASRSAYSRLMAMTDR